MTLTSSSAPRHRRQHRHNRCHRFIGISASTLTIALLAIILAAGCAGRSTLPTGNAGAMFQQAEKLYGEERFNRAIEAYQHIQNEYPDTDTAMRALLRVADCHYHQNQLDDAFTNYTDFLKFHPDHPLAPYAAYQIGMTHYARVMTIDRDLAPMQTALISFRESLAAYPDSPPYTAKMIQRINDCRRRLAKREFYVGLFYFKQKRYEAAASRFRYLLKEYPGYIDDKTLYYLGVAKLNRGEAREGQEALLALTGGYPHSPYTPEARQLLGQQEGPGVQLAFLVRDYFIDHQDDIDDRYVTTRFMPEGHSPRFTSMFFADRDGSSAPAGAEVTFETLFREVPGTAASRIDRDRTTPKAPNQSALPPRLPREPPQTGLRPGGDGPSGGPEAAPVAPGTMPPTTDIPRQTAVPNLPDPLEIVSDWTEANRQQGTVTFGGRVIARQRDMVLYTDRLTNYFDMQSREMKQAVATGNVRLSQADKFATCEQATLDQTNRVVVLRGNAVMWQGTNRVTGDRIVIYLNTNQAEVFGAPGGKARVRITPETLH